MRIEAAKQHVIRHDVVVLMHKDLVQSTVIRIYRLRRRVKIQKWIVIVRCLECLEYRQEVRLQLYVSSCMFVKNYGCTL